MLTRFYLVQKCYLLLINYPLKRSFLQNYLKKKADVYLSVFLKRILFSFSSNNFFIEDLSEVALFTTV